MPICKTLSNTNAFLYINKFISYDFYYLYFNRNKHMYKYKQVVFIRSLKLFEACEGLFLGLCLVSSHKTILDT